MGNNRKIRHEITPDLINQNFNNVLNSFFNIGDTIQSNNFEDHKNYVTIRLVTIIEQFFRKIIEEQIKKEIGTIPKEITIQTQDIDKIKDITKEIIISTSYNFQNIDAIKDLEQYKINLNLDVECKLQIKKLFSSRHDVVHTVIDTNYNIKKGYDVVERLIKDTLTESCFKNEFIFYFVKGNYQFENKKYGNAIECYDNAIRIDPNHANAYYNKGVVLAELGKTDDAIECYDNAIRIDPNHANAYYNKGVVLAELGKTDDAIECFDNAIRIDPKDANAYYNKGVTLAELGKTDDAIECYDNAIRIDPNHANAYYNKGVTLAELGKTDDAIECYDNAIRIDPKDANAYSNKGVTLAELGKTDDAIECYDNAIRIDPNHANAYYNKGVALAKLGKTNDAIECYDNAIKLDPKLKDSDLEKILFK